MDEWRERQREERRGVGMGQERSEEANLKAACVTFSKLDSSLIVKFQFQLLEPLRRGRHRCEGVDVFDRFRR